MVVIVVVGAVGNVAVMDVAISECGVVVGVTKVVWWNDDEGGAMGGEMIIWKTVQVMTTTSDDVVVMDKVRCPARRSPSRGAWSTKCSSTCSFIGVTIPPRIELSAANGVTQFFNIDMHETSHTASEFIHKLVIADLDPATAKLAISFLGPFLSAFGFLFILRIVMSWYPKLPVEKFPYVLAYAPTEPLLSPTRKVIPPLAGVDVTPVVWFGLISFLSEILVGPQGLLVLLSQKV
ncbi:hypothetical protein RHGRI_017442 [Rhododendron griersonianum]|uniref:Protein COFACTOR ASSEMBLY OF COMPLEX C SUBUNIT B CCB3, chloroplastic n=1 Tax=Rhododendron griersonianum TaxID=479676 RepID=A0AAV6JXU3_9ERIC|nr:hypothetical protein RHGRI_017442 [Rhododendron griersonianum]